MEQKKLFSLDILSIRFIQESKKMFEGLPYKAWLDGLPEERMENKRKIYVSIIIKTMSLMWIITSRSAGYLSLLDNQEGENGK